MVFFMAITYFSQNKFAAGNTAMIPMGPSILGEISTNIYNHLPSQSRDTLNNLSRLPVTEFVTDKLNYIKENSDNFPQKQIKDIQKSLIQLMADEFKKKVDNQ